MSATGKFSVATLLLAFCFSAHAQEEVRTIDVHASVSPLPHFWEAVFGSGRANLSLREGYRKDLTEVHDHVGMRYVRFHAILHDENGVYDEDDKGQPIYNFTYVDQIYDGLLSRGVRPFVEISFMPKKLASDKDAIHPFWYKQNVSPPKDYSKWDALIRAFAQHLVDRYGIDEVGQWYFEIWNEPNIDFWAGKPKQATYFELYDHTARDLKAVSPRLRVGGPATAAAHWIHEFISHVAQEHTPIDFISTHGYADDTVEDMFGMNEEIPMRDRVCRAIQMVHGQIAKSALPELPLFWTEWNVPSYGDLNARDSWYVGAALAKDVHDCNGYVREMSFWTFDDVFEEGGPPSDPFHGGFGLITEDGIKKPSFYGFSLLHELGDERLKNAADDVIVTRRKDGALVIALWNLLDLDRAKDGKDKTVRLEFEGLADNQTATIERTDEKHGNPLPTYQTMGSPQYSTQVQIARMNEASSLPAPEQVQLKGRILDVSIPVNGLAIVTIRVK
ncbi:glycosyl hydrolase family 39 [Acidicapsa dinghuensis]|uniref:Glycosyl hydrolase family 39 n=1 Tax=Acidicapsa dinghuensis TaxID=2218256 RepID=A0ABW1EE80_9BACT|nr:glycosyl hydrolase family 39 [Acidicapsa dinghuensis]